MEGILGDGSHPVGPRGEDPIGGLVDEPPSNVPSKLRGRASGKDAAQQFPTAAQ